MRRMAVLFGIFCVLVGSVLADGFERFVTRDGDRLMDGNQELRFISFNIPNLHYVEDDMAFMRVNPFRLPDAFEIKDALETIKQMGGQVVRIYSLPTFQKSESPDTPKYVLAPGTFHEEAFQTLDQVLELCNKTGIRVIIPFVNNFQWWGGVADYAEFRGKKRDEFWTDPQLMEDFKKTVNFVVNRVNTITGVAYKDDKAILCWETGNEPQCPHSWTHEVLAYVKSLDSNHLTMDGYLTSVLRQDSVDDAVVDIVQTHHYENDARHMVDNIRKSAAMAKGKKPYLLGEFGFISTEAVRAVLDTTIQEGFSGALIWSLRYHSRDGGFFWHHEPSGGDFFKAYHWPGFPSGFQYDEKNLMALMREKAYEIQDQAVPELPVPQPPVMLPIAKVSAISWQGSVGAESYDVERAESKRGPWKTLAYGMDDGRVQYRPLFNDPSAEIGKTYYYRVRAKNAMGVSKPSKPSEAVKVESLALCDELENFSSLFTQSKKLQIVSNEARKYKEDIHRLHGDKGEWVIYRVPGAVQTIRLFAFSADAKAEFAVGVSSEGREFTPVAMKKTDYSGGEGEYGYTRPLLFEADAVSGNASFVRIEYQSASCLSRVEIEYQ